MEPLQTPSPEAIHAAYLQGEQAVVALIEGRARFLSPQHIPLRRIASMLRPAGQACATRLAFLFLYLSTEQVARPREGLVDRLAQLPPQRERLAQPAAPVVIQPVARFHRQPDEPAIGVVRPGGNVHLQHQLLVVVYLDHSVFRCHPADAVTGRQANRYRYPRVLPAVGRLKLSVGLIGVYSICSRARLVDPDHCRFCFSTHPAFRMGKKTLNHR